MQNDTPERVLAPVTVTVADGLSYPMTLGKLAESVARLLRYAPPEAAVDFIEAQSGDGRNITASWFEKRPPR